MRESESKVREREGFQRDGHTGALMEVVAESSTPSLVASADGLAGCDGESVGKIIRKFGFDTCINC